MEVRIDNPDHNGNGEILARGSNVMLGYYGMPEKTREVIDADGWLHTGDIGKLDEDGYLYITGRLKNIIVTKGGKNIYPEEIENLLQASPLLSEVVVVGKLDSDGGEYPHAIIYPDPEVLAAMQAGEDASATTRCAGSCAPRSRSAPRARPSTRSRRASSCPRWSCPRPPRAR